jgi:hypothetical protein
MSDTPSLLSRLVLAWAWVRRQEPARVQAAWRAVVGVLAAAGVTVSTEFDGRVMAVIAAVFVLLTISQGEQTRNRVLPVAKVIPGTVLADGQIMPPEGRPA